MAVDTPAKRLSMLGFGSEVVSDSLIFPDGDIDQGDRQALLWGYSGLLWDEPATAYRDIIGFCISKASSLETFNIAKNDLVTYYVAKDGSIEEYTIKKGDAIIEFEINMGDQNGC